MTAGGRVRRVVSLVPSLTEAVAASDPEVLVGVTDWCTHPEGLAARRVGGTKNPRVAEIAGLAPDLVLANEEENRKPDLDALRAAGMPVRVTWVRSLPEAFAELDAVLTADCGLPRPKWLDEAEAAWAELAEPPPGPGGLSRSAAAVVPIWRRPWMVLGSDTFAGDLLRRLGVRNQWVESAGRYPEVPLDRLLDASPELVVLPDEPYLFTAEDGPEAFPGVPTALLSGRHLTWYGPSLAEAPTVLDEQLAAARVRF